MKIVVMGSGGVGGYFGARLAKGGADVTFVARGAHLAAMRENGLTIIDDGREVHLPHVNAMDDPAAIGAVDLVLFAVKLWDSYTAIGQIAPIMGPDTAVISFQNGVHKDDVLIRAFGRERVMGGVCYITASIARPGIIERTGAFERLVFGEFDGVVTPRARRFLQACRNGGINADMSGDIRREVWQKFVFLVGFSGATSAMHSTIGPIRSHPQTREFLLDLMREVVAVGRAHDVDPSPDFPDGWLKTIDGLAPDATSSMHHDLERGNRLELDWLAGAVVELGRAVGVPTPLNRAVTDILALHTGGRRTA